MEPANELGPSLLMGLTGGSDFVGNRIIFIIIHYEICVRRGGSPLTHSARTPPAVHPGITIWVDDIKLEKKL